MTNGDKSFTEQWLTDYDLYKETKARVKEVKKLSLDDLQEKSIYNDAALKKAQKDLLKCMENSLLNPENLADFLLNLAIAGATIVELWNQFDGFIKMKHTLGFWGSDGSFNWTDPDNIDRDLNPSLARAFDRHGATGTLKLELGLNTDLGGNDGARPAPGGMLDENGAYILIGINLSW